MQRLFLLYSEEVPSGPNSQEVGPKRDVFAEVVVGSIEMHEDATFLLSFYLSEKWNPPPSRFIFQSFIHPKDGGGS